MKKVKLVTFVSLVMLLVIATVYTQGMYEEQLAGVRLGAPFIDYDENGRLKKDCVLAIYGMPDIILQGPTPTPRSVMDMIEQTVRGGQMMPGSPTMPGGPMSPGTPGRPMMPGGIGGMGSGFGGQPTMPSVMAGVSGMATLAGAPMGAPRMPYVPGTPGMSIEMPSEGASSPALPGGNVGGIQRLGQIFVWPNPKDWWWSIPPFFRTESNNYHFIYKLNGATLNLLMELVNNRFEVIGITVAGKKYDGARTAQGNPFKSIKLGDNMQRVILRYNRPDEIIYYNPFTLEVIAASTRNMILRYYIANNIEFTILNDKVVRIFIFKPNLRDRLVKLPLPARLGPAGSSGSNVPWRGGETGQ